MPDVLIPTFNRLQTRKPESLRRYRGKVALIINTASFGGCTPINTKRWKRYRKYKDRGVVVVVSSNDFG